MDTKEPNYGLKLLQSPVPANASAFAPPGQDLPWACAQANVYYVPVQVNICSC